MDLLALGASDCEALREGWLGQPVNALSSVAYLVAGAWAWGRGGSKAVSLALMGVGVGSVLYHGPMPAGAEAVHDGSIIALGGAGLLALWRGEIGAPTRAAAGTLAAALLVNVLSRTGEPLCRPDSLLQGHAAWHVLSATGIALWLVSGAAAREAGGRGRRHQPDH